MIPVDITNREEAMEWLLRHGYSVDVAKKSLKIGMAMSSQPMMRTVRSMKKK